MFLKVECLIILCIDWSYKHSSNTRDYNSYVQPFVNWWTVMMKRINQIATWGLFPNKDYLVLVLV